MKNQLLIRPCRMLEYRIPDINDLSCVGGWLGAMAQSNNESPELSPILSDLRTAAHLGQSVANSITTKVDGSTSAYGCVFDKRKLAAITAAIILDLVLSIYRALQTSSG